MNAGVKPIPSIAPMLAVPMLAIPMLAMLSFAGLAAAASIGEAAPTETASPSGQPPALAANPGAVLAGVARHLDLEANIVVLSVEAMPITQGDVANVVRTLPVSFGSLSAPEIFRHAMDVLIRQKVMVLNAEKLGLDKDPAVVQQGKIAFEKVLADAWLTRRSDAAVSDAALHARYDREFAGQPGPEEVRAQVILVATEVEARGLIEKLRGGADFAGLARQFSKDPTAAAGGDLGYASLDSISPEVGAVMFALSPGQISPYPVLSGAGYFVVRVEARRRRATPDFDQVRARLEQELRGDAVRDAVASLLTEVKIAPAQQPPK